VTPYEADIQTESPLRTNPIPLTPYESIHTMPLDPEPVEENLLSFEQLQVIELIEKPAPKSENDL